jgi:hypothetical protein
LTSVPAEPSCYLGYKTLPAPPGSSLPVLVKDGNLYIVNRNSMGKFNSGSNKIYQELPGALPGGI